MLLMTMSLSSYSQSLSNKPTECVVPCYTLKNALVMKESKDLIEKQLLISRDSIRIMTDIIKEKDNLITNKDKQIDLYKNNEDAMKGIVKEKELQVGEYKKLYRREKRLKYLGFGSGLIGLGVAALLVL
jgi:hypothetical protein